MLCSSSLSCTFNRTLNYVWKWRRTRGKGHKLFHPFISVDYINLKQSKWSQMSTWITVLLLIILVRHLTIIISPHQFKIQFDPHLMTLIFMATSKCKHLLQVPKGLWHCKLRIQNHILAFAGKSQKFCFKNISSLSLLNLIQSLFI